MKTSNLLAALFAIACFYSFGQNGTCLTADPFCTGTPVTFPGGVGTGTAEVGPDYGCLLTQPNPAWFYMEIATGGNLDIEISNSNNEDIDFILFGPFADQTTPCTALLTAGNTVDCSYSTTATETANIVGAVAGEYYLMMLTNFSNNATDISFMDMPSSTATTNCAIACPPVDFGVYNGTTTEPLPATMNCDDAAVLLLADEDGFNPGQQISPCIVIQVFPTNANTTLNVEFFENGTSLGSLTPGANTNWSGYLSLADPDVSHAFVLSEGVATGANMTYEVLDCNTGTVLASGTWVDDGNPQTVTINPPPNLSGLASYSISPAAGAPGLTTFDWGGAIFDPSLVPTGTYDITYSWDDGAGNCSDVVTQTVTVVNPNDATFSYLSTNYCTSDADPSPTVTQAGGTFTSAPPGLAINGTTGAIDVSVSTPGSYTVTHFVGTAIPSTCNDTETFGVTIDPIQSAMFSYGAFSYCTADVDPLPTISGVAGGTFTSVPAGLSINASTGEVDLSASTPNTYTVTYTTPGPCPGTQNQLVTVTAVDDASFNYSAASYCANDADPTPTITGVAGGTFSSTAGLSINASTGEIDLSASTPNTYTVTYTTSGACSNSSNVSVTINPLDDASFNYSAAAYCVTDADPTPTITGLAGGTFSSTAGLSINTTTGAIDVSASTPNTYTVTYTTTGPCPSSSNVSVTINALDDASFNYSAAAYCVTDADPTPTITGLAGGTFSSTAGLSINASTGAIDLSASTPNTYTVTYTTAGTCPNSSNVSVTINPLDDASFNYSAAAYCVTDTDPTPTITGLTGGTFSSTAGLSINATTGAIDVSASTPNTYTVTYTTTGTCPNSSNVSVTINPLDDASFNYSAAAYCVSDADPTPTITGLTGGTFSSTAGLSINASTGAIDVSASTPNTYTITYTTAGTCPNSSNVSVTINPLDDASFNYGAAAYCVSDADPTPTITGVAGGTFSSTAGLSINASTGAIDVSASTPNTYTVTYTTAGTCPNSSNVSVTINPLDDASFNYGAASYCLSDADPTPTVTGVAGGTFSSTAGLSINTTTGEIDVSASTPNTYTVTYTTAGTCPNSSNVSVTITALDDASFNYSAAAYCVSDADPTPTITGVAGGTFSSTAGLSINASTGEIDVSASTPNTYTVTYTTSGACANSSNVSVTINPLDDASFNYSAAAYCVSDADPTPTITGLTGGTFSSTAGLSISASTGAIDVSASTPNTYTVTYTTAGTCPNSSNVSVTINPLDDASFNYGAAAYCVTDADPTPTITGLTGGTFSSTAGLSINASTGAIDVSASTPNTYTVTYTTAGTCPNSSNVSVTINPLDDASFNYGAAAYCVSDADPTPTITGVAGGTFSSTAGLSINASTGAIDVSASTPNTYTVTYTTAGTCPNSSNVSVTINPLDDASFNYSAASYCVSDADPTPTVTGVAGGTFSSTAGLSINATTGEIDVSASTPNTYTVTYTTAGTCPNSSNVSVTITALDDASFNYSAAAYCPNDTDPTPTITGVAGGTFSSTAGLSINASTGEIDLSASTPNTYTVTYTTSGTCSNSSNVSVTINPLDDATFNYSAALYCVNGSDPTPTITGTTGGTFSSTAGLSINASTGAIDVSASTPNTYTVTYTTGGLCPAVSNVSVTISLLDDASFNYASPAFCADANDQACNITGVPGGSFSSLPAGLSISPTTGLINVAGSTPGIYTVTYLTIGACPNSSNQVVTINALPTVTASNSGPICPEAVSFTANETGGQATSWSWSSNGAAVITTGSDQNPTITGAVDGEVFTVTGTDANGCAASAQTTISFYTSPTVTAANSGPACSGASFTVNETGGDVNSWNWTSSGGAVITSSGDQSPTITSAVDGEVFTVTGTDANGCIATDQTTITIVPQPALDPIADVVACGGYVLPAIQGANLSGNEAYFDDSQANGGSPISGNLTTSQTVWVYDGNGTCSNEISFDVTINEIPTATNIAGEGTYCEGDLVTDITVDVTGNGPWTIDYTLNGTAQSASGATSPVSLGNAPGEYILVAVYDANCSNTATGTQTIIVNTYPTAPTAGTDTEYCSGTFFDDMIATGSFGEFTWYSDSLLTDVLGTGSTLVPNDVIGVTTYYVTETTNGCEGPWSDVTITVNACDIVVPTAFTPDGDMINDIWEILYIDITYPNSQVYVYNRWGNMVYSSDQGAYYNRPWDGTYNGEALPVGSYYYVIKTNDETADKEAQTGTVSIILNK